MRLATSSDALDGWWWLPGRHDEALFGRLSAGASGSWELQVYGSLEGGTAGSTSAIFNGDELSTAPVIHGHLMRGAPEPRFVTLIGCWQHATNETVGGAAHGERTESWSFEEVVTGHTNVAADERVVAIRVRLSNLLDWTGPRRPHVEWSDDAASASVASTDLGRAELAGATVDLVLDHNATVSATEATLRHQVMFHVAIDDTVTFSSAMSEYALPLRSMLSFLTLGHVDVESVAVTLDRHQNDRRPIWFDYRTRLQKPIDEPKQPRHHEMLATWPDLAEMTVDGLLGNWFKLRQQVEKTLTLLLLPHHAPFLYTDDHLMTAFVAMEAYHQAKIGGTSVEPEKHKKRVDAVVAAAPEEYRDWTREMLANRNQKGQRRKIMEIIGRSGPTGEAVLAAAPRFVDLALKSRHGVAHPGPSGGQTGATYLALSYGLRWMLRHCLLVDLGLSEERAAELTGANKRFADECELIKRWTPGS